MQALTQDQIEVIESAVVRIRSAYNSFDVEPCHFKGVPGDFSSLDFIPYELPMAAEFAAGSLAFSLAWGNVLATSFGFTWVSSRECVDPREFALHNEDASALIFPYFRLLEISHRSSPAVSLWFETLRYVDRVFIAPDGWHPVFDAVHCPDKLTCTSATTKACRRVVDMVPEFYAKMGMFPYTWALNQQWNELAAYADQFATNYRLLDR